MKPYSLFALMLFTQQLIAQIPVTGSVKNKAGMPLAFVNIGIREGKIGTITNEKGIFELTLPDSVRKLNLTFSSIGYEEQTIAISTIKKELAITLEEKVMQLAAVEISNKKRKVKRLGITGRSPFVSIPSTMYKKNDVIEQARLIHVKEPLQILDANIYILSAADFPVNIRLNFYAVANGMPGKRLIEKTIMRTASLKQGWFKIDLSKDDIYVAEDFVVSFEYLPNENKIISFGAKLGAADSFLRSSSLGAWRKNALGGCSIFVTTIN